PHITKLNHCRGRCSDYARRCQNQTYWWWMITHRTAPVFGRMHKLPKTIRSSFYTAKSKTAEVAPIRPRVGGAYSARMTYGRTGTGARHTKPNNGRGDGRARTEGSQAPA